MSIQSHLSRVVRVARIAAGLGLGIVLAIPELVAVVMCGLIIFALRGRTRPGGPAVATVNRMLRVVTDWEFRRVAWFAGKVEVEYTPRHPWLYLAVRPWLGLLAGAIGVLIVYGFGVGVQGAVLWMLGHEIDDIPPSMGNVIYLFAAGAVLAFLAFQGLAGVVVLERLLALRLLGPSREQVLADRVSTLMHSRAAVVEAVDAERRRIERDLHDGLTSWYAKPSPTPPNTREHPEWMCP